VDRLLTHVAYGEDSLNGAVAVSPDGRWRHGELTGTAAPLPESPKLLGAAARRAGRLAVAATVVLVGAGAASACSSQSSAGSAASTPAASAATSTGAPSTVVQVGQFGIDDHPASITVQEVPSIRTEVPQSILSTGKLVIGVGALPSGFPPLAYVGSNQTTLTGSEPDLGRLIAAVFGLTPDVENASWENLFVRITSGEFNVGFSNITDTDLRQKQGYDFATYRKDELAFEVLKSNPWEFNGNYENLAGQTVAVAAGTNQQEILRTRQKDLKAQGKTLNIKYFNDVNSTYLALDSGRITAVFQPNPSSAYHVIQDANTPDPTRVAGIESGAGPTIQGLISAMTKHGDGLVKPLADAINYLMKNGDYAKWLNVYGLAAETVPTSQVNPPGLPLSISS
jgi:polar amino acid transport system substrate-binding protein